MIDRITEVRAEVENVGLASQGRLKGTATVEYKSNTLTIPLSRNTLKTLEECVERDVDLALGEMQS